MKITTTDSMSVDGFEGVQTVAGSILKTAALQNVEKKVQKKYITYKTIGGKQHSVKVVSLKHPTTAQTSKLLNDMKLCDWHGRVYSASAKVFHVEFVKPLYCILKCLTNISTEQQPKISSSQLKDVLKWLVPVMDAVGCYSKKNERAVANSLSQLA